MPAIRWALFSLLSLATGGCSIYPLPEDTTGFASEDIATIIRCQTRDAIREEIVANIAAAKSPFVYQRMTKDQLIETLRASPEYFRSLNWNDFAKELRDPFLFYKDTSISYDFTIDSTEVNGNGIDLTLLKSFSSGTDKIGVTAKNDRTREVKRHFRVYDSFDSLARLSTEGMCDIVPKQINAIYPAAGLLKIRSLVHSFLVQNQLGNLAGENSDYTTAQMTDTITFTTKFTGNVDPSTQLNPVAGKFVPSNLAANFDNSRQDMHTIIILIRLPPNKSGLPRFDEIGRITLAPKEASKAAASEALDRQREFNTQDALVRLGTGIGRFP
ncbi:hypothetical protein [Bradyrhizobium sp. CCBAU 45394]|uniref:hypothetical protein n=1 Tax=Bradyrhizobium sp. CCBAU 45394 TaxID=1325087 RepID=UPI002302CF2C|nr:hypothetical protein [Bradyrhizobium sp. CCBAU 45394]